MSRFDVITDTLATLQFTILHIIAYSSFKEETRMNLGFSSSKLISRLDGIIRGLINE